MKKLSFIIIVAFFLVVQFTQIRMPVLASTIESSTRNNDLYDQNYIEEDTQKNRIELWEDILFPICVEFIGAFLGIISALALNAKSENKKYKDLNQDLYDELINLQTELIDRKNRDYMFYQYLTPVWDINLAAGNLSFLTNQHINQDFLNIYAKIQYAQTLEKEHIQCMYFLHNSSDEKIIKYKDTIDAARIREAENIVNMITTMQKRIDNNARRNH